MINNLLSGLFERAQSASPPNSLHSNSGRDPYRGVVIVLLVGALLGASSALAGGLMLRNPVLLDVAVTLGIATGVLIGVALAQSARARPLKKDEGSSSPAPTEETEKSAQPQVSSKWDASKASSRLVAVRAWISRWFRRVGAIRIVRASTAGVGVAAIVLVLRIKLPISPPALLVAGIAAALCLVAAGLAAIGARYLADIEAARLPEGPGLCRGARVIAWILVLAAVSMGLAWAKLNTFFLSLHFIVLTIDAAVCYGLFMVKQPEHEVLNAFPLDLGVLSTLGSRANILGSILDSAEAQLGIDLRSTWALTVVRRTLEPLLIGLCLMGWLSTSLTVVGVDEQGLVERLGVPLGGQPLMPGLHLHWPWPIDQISRIPVLRVQVTQVGHEGEEAEAAGPENALWAVQHAPNEFTLLLSDGRDLITVAAAVQYRITDARAWRYHSQNPAVALRAIAYRAVTRSTVNRTLADALSQNIATLTGQMRAMVQQDADALGLGVEIKGFTVAAMHPPVPVSPDYEAVVSAEIRKTTAIVLAQAYRNAKVPSAEALVVAGGNNARAEGAKALALAAGEAWSFRMLESQYRASPEEYFFRRRLETLEKELPARRFTVVDSRIQRDGGELWLTQ